MPGPCRYREQLSGLMTSIDPYTVGADSISARRSMRQRKPRGGVKTAWRRTTSAASQQSWPAHAVVCPAGANIVRSPISLRSTVGPRSQLRTSAGRRGRNPLQRQYGNFSTTANGRGGLRAGRPTSSRLRNFQGKIPPSLSGRIPISQTKKVVPTIHRQHDLSYLNQFTPAGTGSGTPRSLHSAGAQKCRRGCLPRR